MGHKKSSQSHTVLDITQRRLAAAERLGKFRAKMLSVVGRTAPLSPPGTQIPRARRPPVASASDAPSSAEAELELELELPGEGQAAAEAEWGKDLSDVATAFEDGWD